jgi:carboxynorspermidine decarboxylase
MEWFNFGGGHHITRSDYDVDHLISLVREFSERWNLHVYLEPGEAHVYNAGFLVGTVLDIIHNGMDIAILDVSATSHMPDVLEMPYRPPLAGSGEVGEKPYSYRLGSPSCLSGDVIGDYSFDQPLEIGDRMVFGDQAQYTMVKTTFFNGIQHPSISLWDSDTGGFQIVKEFGYNDFLNRLG